MEDPQVIAEIDALIDSYNWEARNIGEPVDVALILKHLLRNPDGLDKMSNKLRGLEPRCRFVMIQVLLNLLEHPRLRDKAWCLQILEITSGRMSQGATMWHRHTDRLFQKAMPLFHRLLNHHRAEYRFWTSSLLTNMPHREHQIALWFLDRLQHERSPRVRSRLLKEFGNLIGSEALTPTLRHKILAYIETLSRAQAPELCLFAAKIALSLLGHHTPDFFVENAIACWPRVGHHKEDFDSAMGFIWAIKYRHKSPTETLDRLISSTHTNTGINVIWTFLDNHRSFPEYRRIMIPPQKRRLLERAILCRDVWSSTRRGGLYWRARGFAPTRSGLRQQLQHSRVYDVSPAPQTAAVRFVLQGSRILLVSELREANRG